jgi:hypothetical protein
VSNRKEALAKAAIQAVGRIWAKTSKLKSNILLTLLKNKTLASKELNEMIIMSICKYVTSLKTPEQLEKNSPMVAMLTTLFVDIQNPNAQIALMKQFFKFGVNLQSYEPYLPCMMTEMLKRLRENFEKQVVDVKLLVNM